MLVVQVTVSFEQYLINCMANLAIIWTFVVVVFSIWELTQKDSLKVLQGIDGQDI